MMCPIDVSGVLAGTLCMIARDREHLILGRQGYVAPLHKVQPSDVIMILLLASDRMRFNVMTASGRCGWLFTDECCLFKSYAVK